MLGMLLQHQQILPSFWVFFGVFFLVCSVTPSTSKPPSIGVSSLSDSGTGCYLTHWVICSVGGKNTLSADNNILNAPVITSQTMQGATP